MAIAVDFSGCDGYFFSPFVTIYCGVTENRHSSCPLQEGEWPHQGEWQTPGDGGASHPPVQGELG